MPVVPPLSIDPGVILIPLGFRTCKPNLFSLLIDPGKIVIACPLRVCNPIARLESNPAGLINDAPILIV